MDSMRAGHGVAIGLLWLVLIGSSSTFAQDFSGLRGTELREVQDLQGGIEDLLGGLLAGGRRLDGSIERIVVRADHERELHLEIHHSDFTAADVRALVLDEERQPIRGLAARASLDSGSEVAEIRLSLPEDVEEGAAFSSTYLKLELMRPGRTAVGRTHVFLLPKQWQVEIRPENVVIEVSPRPVGPAERLDRLASEFRLRPAAAGGTSVRPERIPVKEPARPAAPVHAEPVAAVRTDVRTAQPRDTGTVERPVLQGPVVFRRDDFMLRYAQAAADTVTAVDTARLVGVLRTDPSSRQVAVRPDLMQLRLPAELATGLSDEQRDAKAEGPLAAPIDILRLHYGGEDAFSDVAQLRGVLGLDPRIYPDKNPDSGVFYFVPASYHLRWAPEDGYAMRILFRTAAEPGTAGLVHMKAGLLGGIGLHDLRAAARLVEAWADRNQRRFTRLDPMPLAAREIRVSFSEDLARLYDIPAERISARISQLLGEMEAEWVTTEPTARDLQVVLEQDALTGTVEFEAAGEVGRQAIPAEISLYRPQTYGSVRWTRDERWRNSTPFPLRLRYLHALVVDTAGRPSIFSWDLGGRVAPPLAQVSIDGGTVPAWLDDLALRTWVDYAVATDCAACARLALDEIKGGATALDRSDIVFHTLAPLADLGAYELNVDVRSRFFDPRDREYRRASSVVLDRDGADFPLGPIYAPAAGAEEEEFFQYRIRAVMRDGSSHPAVGDPEWIPAYRLRVPIGSVQVRQSVGYLPRADEPGAHDANRNGGEPDGVHR